MLQHCTLLIFLQIQPKPKEYTKNIWFSNGLVASLSSLWNIHCSKQIQHLLTAVYSLDTLALGNQYIFTPIICSSRWALGINFFCIHPIGKNYKIEHFSSKSSPNPRNTQRTSDFPMVWWLPWLPFEISTAVSRSHIWLLQCIVWKLWF